MSEFIEPSKQVSAAKPVATQVLQRRIKLPLRSKIVIPYLVLALVLTVGVSLLVSRIVFDTADERYKNQLIETAKITAEITVAQETRSLETLRLLTNVQGVSEALANGNAEELRSLTLGVVINSRTEAVEFIHANGQHVLAMHHVTGGNVEEYEFSQGGDASISQWDFVRKILSSESDSQGNKYAGVVNTAWGKYVYIAGPVFNAGNQLTGVVLIGQSLPEIVTEIRAQTLAQVSLYTPAGELLHSSFINPQSLQTEDAAFVFDQQDVESMSRELQKRGIVSANVAYDEILKPWELRNGEDVGIIGLALPKTLFVRASTITRIQIFIILLVAILLVIWVGNKLANSIAHPVTRLARAAFQVSQGDLKVQIPITTSDEISILAQSFNNMVQSVYQSRNNLVEAYDSTLLGWSKALELRDEETEGHTQRVTEMAVALAGSLGIAGEDLENVRRGAILHDIGKMAIPDSILRKPASLTPEERKIIEKHPQYACEMLKEINYLRPALKIPYAHHEKWNGTGYPQGLKGEEIPLEARIFAVVDVWDAMSSDRIYRKALSIEQVMKYFHDQSGTHFDPGVVAAFYKLMEDRQDLFDNA